MRQVLTLSLLLALASGAAARPPLRDAERHRAADRQAEAQAAQAVRNAAEEEDRLAQARVESAARLRTTEARLAELTAQMDALKARREQVEGRLEADSASLSPLLPLAQRLARYPAETILAVPLPPGDAVRGLIVLRGLAADTAADAARLGAEQAELTRLQDALAAALPQLDAARGVQATQSAQLDAQLAAARTTHAAADDAASEAARRAAASAARAESVPGVVDRIDRSHRKADQKADKASPQQGEAGAPAENGKSRETDRPARPLATGQLLVPVAGTVLRPWGARTDAGEAQGVSYGAPAGARVVSPCAGRVVFAGPFRSYGQLLIVDCGAGLHAVLAGFDHLDVPVGRQVLAGEPVGVMGAGRPSLYLELRRGGQAMNPALFLKAPFPT